MDKNIDCWSGAIKMRLDFKRLGALMSQARGGLSHREYVSGGPVTASTWYRVENGKTPSLYNFVAICDWMDIDPGVVLRQLRSSM